MVVYSEFLIHPVVLLTTSPKLRSEITHGFSSTLQETVSSWWSDLQWYFLSCNPSKAQIYSSRKMSRPRPSLPDGASISWDHTDHHKLGVTMSRNSPEIDNGDMIQVKKDSDDVTEDQVRVHCPHDGHAGPASGQEDGHAVPVDGHAVPSDGHAMTAEGHIGAVGREFRGPSRFSSRVSPPSGLSTKTTSVSSSCEVRLDTAQSTPQDTVFSTPDPVEVAVRAGRHSLRDSGVSGIHSVAARDAHSGVGRDTEVSGIHSVVHNERHSVRDSGVSERHSLRDSWVSGRHSVLSGQDEILPWRNRNSITSDDSVMGRTDSVNSNPRVDCFNSFVNVRKNSVNSVGSFNPSVNGRKDSINNSVVGIKDGVNYAVNGRKDSINNSLYGRIDSINNSVNGKTGSINNAANGRIDSLNSSVNGRNESINNSLNGRIDSVNICVNGRNDSVEHHVVLRSGSKLKSDVIYHRGDEEEETFSQSIKNYDREKQIFGGRNKNFTHRDWNPRKLRQEEKHHSLPPIRDYGCWDSPFARCPDKEYHSLVLGDDSSSGDAVSQQGEDDPIPRCSGHSSLNKSFPFPFPIPPVQMPKQVILVEETLGNNEIFI